MKKYTGLALVALVLGLVALGAARAWKPAAAPVAHETAQRPVELHLEITPQGLEPAVTSVPKDRRVVVHIHNARRTVAGMSLQGYQDRVTIGQIAPDSVWRGEFVADRPGEDFAWMVEGEPRGRFVVRGSHLIEGHR